MLLNPEAERDADTEALAQQGNRILESTYSPEAKMRSSRVSNAIAGLMGAREEDQDRILSSLSEKDMALQVMEFMCMQMHTS